MVPYWGGSNRVGYIYPWVNVPFTAEKVHLPMAPKLMNIEIADQGVTTDSAEPSESDRPL